MAALIAVGVTLALAAGAAVKFLLKCSWTRAVVGTAVAILNIVATVMVGTNLAVGSNSTFHEYWNGWETAADQQVTTCTEDGACEHTYQCDPYTTVETYTTSDAKGHVQVHTRVVTRYHQCPVGDQEVTYVVRTTVGDQTVSSHQFSPQTRPWRAGVGLGGVPTQPPAAWVAVRDRLAAGDPGPATSVHDYTNWVLASERTMLHQYSGAIAQYTKEGLLPNPASGLSGLFAAEKTHFVGGQVSLEQQAQWATATARTAAALGTQKQGDLQVVLVHDDRVTNPDEYTSALLAYWQRPELHRDALAKNSVVLVAGTHDGATVAWARVVTGMPVGNDGLQAAARTQLVGVPWTPQALIGVPQVTPAGATPVAKVSANPGAFEKLAWDTTNGYTRVHMSAKDGQTGFGYLKADAAPTTGQWWAIAAVMLVLLALTFLVTVADFETTH